MLLWRRFQFFNCDEVREEGETPGTPPALAKLVVNCTASGRGKLLVGDGEGFVHMIERSFKSSFFQAFGQTIYHMKQLKSRNVLVAVGEDETQKPTLKIFSLDKLGKGGNPTTMREVKLVVGGKGPQPMVTCLDAQEDLSQVAVGFDNGAVMLIRGNDISRDRFTKTKVLAPESGAPVTGIVWKNSSLLFVATTDAVLMYDTSLRDAKMEIDQPGCEARNFITSDDGDVIVGRQEAVYYLDQDGRGKAFGFTGKKDQILWFRNYLVVAFAEPEKAQGTANLFVYDLTNKFIAFPYFFSSITFIAHEWGCLFVFTNDKKIFKLEEKDTQSKLDLLFKKHHYAIAVALATSQAGSDPGMVADIYRRNAVHLYDKGNYELAIAEFIQTIGWLEPSYVIRKFLDAQRIHNLTLYLQALHQRNLASADHTTLLLNCYTKLKDIDNLDRFIRSDTVNFDVETAIKVCRSTRYYEHALFLARKYHEHDQFLKIQLEDVGSQADAGYVEAMNYIRTLDFEQAERNLKKYGKTLVTRLPEQTTNLLITLCTGYKRNASSVSAAAAMPQDIPGLTIMNDDAGDDDRASLFAMPTKKKVKAAPAAASAAAQGPISNQRANPAEFIHIYVDQMKWLTVFLEVIVKEVTDVDPVIYDTLLELYLKPSDGESAAQVEQRLDKARELLANHTITYDTDQALILCKMHDFRAGVLLLLEKMKLYDEIVQYYMEINEHDAVLRACRRYGETNPNLWIKVLSYFGAKEQARAEIAEVLEHIDRNNLLPPLLVIQLLAKNPSATLATVKDYIQRRLKTEEAAIAADQTEARKKREETERMRNEIDELKTQAKIFQMTKCSSCNNPLDLPTTHFLCMHAFHQRCLTDIESECPICAPDNHNVMKYKRSLEEKANDHDLFFKQLEGSADGFSVVSDYFSRVVFNKVVLVDGGEADYDMDGTEREQLGI